MPKNFDEARALRAEKDRSFVIGGHTFVYRASVAPEKLMAWSQLTANEIPSEELTEARGLAIFDETVLAFLEPGHEDAWAAVRDPEGADPLNLDDIEALISWLFEEASGRPTEPSSDSSTGSPRAGTGTPSTDASVSLAVAG